MEVWFFYKKGIWGDRFDIRGNVNNVAKKLVLIIKVKYQHFAPMSVVTSGSGIILGKEKSLINISAHTAVRKS